NAGREQRGRQYQGGRARPAAWRQAKSNGRQPAESGYAHAHTALLQRLPPDTPTTYSHQASFPYTFQAPGPAARDSGQSSKPPGRGRQHVQGELSPTYYEGPPASTLGQCQHRLLDRPAIRCGRCQATLLVQGQLQYLRQMERAAVGLLRDLLAAAKAVGNDQRLWISPAHRRQEHALARFDRDVVVLA